MGSRIHLRSPPPDEPNSSPTTASSGRSTARCSRRSALDGPVGLGDRGQVRLGVHHQVGGPKPGQGDASRRGRPVRARAGGRPRSVAEGSRASRTSLAPSTTGPGRAGGRRVRGCGVPPTEAPLADRGTRKTETPRADGEQRYRRKLLWLLSVATFFEGYDTSCSRSSCRRSWPTSAGPSPQAGLVRAITSIGAGWPRSSSPPRPTASGAERLLLITIVGYTIGDVATAFSADLVALTAAQFVAQFFLGAEWAVAVTIVVEEFPPRRPRPEPGDRHVDEHPRRDHRRGGGLRARPVAYSGSLDWRSFYVRGRSSR